KEEHTNAQHNGYQQHGDGNPVKAHTRGFNGGNLVGFGEQAEVDECGYKDAERKHQVDNLREKEAEIIENYACRYVVADHITQKLEEVENNVNPREGNQQDEKVESPTLDNVDVENLKDPASGGSGLQGRLGETSAPFADLP